MKGDIYNGDKHYAKFTDKEIIVDAGEVDLNDMLDKQLTTISPEETDTGVTVYYRELPSVTAKLIALESFGFRIVVEEPMTKSFNKENVLPGPEQKAEATNYYSFLDKTFKSWQNKVMGEFDEQISPEVETKSLNNLISLILGTFAVKNLYDGLKTVIKQTMNQGLESAESETGVDIGFPTTVDMKVNIEVSKQINGFTIEGKKWDGLKGVTMDLTDDIRTAVTTGLAENKSLVDIKNDVNNVFVKMIGTPESEGRIMKIARTETTRIQNEAKLEAFNNSGLDGFKVWDSFLDNRTSPICESLNGQRVPLNQSFVDPVTGKEFMHPPAHVNCRSVIRWEPSD